MKFPDKLEKGRFIKRYKRFFADIELPNQEVLTTHCANTGSMLNLKQHGAESAFLYKNNPKAKLKASWELVKNNKTWVCINTTRANAVVAEALEQKLLPAFKSYTKIEREKKYGDSRIDFRLSNLKKTCWVEVKSVTLSKGKTALFPDAVTERGLKHLLELEKIYKDGDEAYIFFLIMRSDCQEFMPAYEIDPKYSVTLQKLIKNKKIKAIAYNVKCTLSSLKLNKKIPIRFKS